MRDQRLTYLAHRQLDASRLERERDPSHLHFVQDDEAMTGAIAAAIHLPHDRSRSGHARMLAEQPR